MSDPRHFTSAETLPLSVLSDLEEFERRRLEEEMETAPTLRQEEAAWEQALGQILAESSEHEPLSAAEIEGMEAKLLDSVRSVGHGSRGQIKARSLRPWPEATAAVDEDRPSRRSWPTLLAVAASLMALSVALWALLGDDSSDDVAQLRRQNVAIANEVADLREALRLNDEAIERVSLSLRTFGYPRSAPIVLAGLEPAPSATGATFYRPSSNEALFYAFGLPQLERGNSYQLWFIADGKPVSAGTFDIDRNGEASLIVADLPPTTNIDLWAVTREPLGGSPQPTGPMLIRG